MSTTRLLFFHNINMSFTNVWHFIAVNSIRFIFRYVLECLEVHIFMLIGLFVQMKYNIFHILLEVCFAVKRSLFQHYMFGLNSQKDSIRCFIENLDVN